MVIQAQISPDMFDVAISKTITGHNKYDTSKTEPTKKPTTKVDWLVKFRMWVDTDSNLRIIMVEDSASMSLGFSIGGVKVCVSFRAGWKLSTGIYCQPSAG